MRTYYNICQDNLFVFNKKIVSKLLCVYRYGNRKTFELIKMHGPIRSSGKSRDTKPPSKQKPNYF